MERARRYTQPSSISSVHLISLHHHPPLTHHLIAASHSFTASPTPRAEILARHSSLINIPRSLLPPPTAGDFTHPSTRYKAEKSIGSVPSTTIPPASVALPSTIVQLGRLKQLDTRGARSARRQEIGLVNIQSGIGLCSLNFNCASISFSGETPDSNPLLTRGSFT